MRVIKNVIVAAAFILPALCQSPQSLSDVKSIYVDSLGQDFGAEIIRDKIIDRLTTSTRFHVVLDVSKADAILTGNAKENRNSAAAVVRLITQDKRILWYSEAKSPAFGFNVSSDLTNRIVKDLTKAATAPPKKK